MTEHAPICWELVRELRVVRALGRLIHERFGLGLAFVDKHGQFVRGCPEPTTVALTSLCAGRHEAGNGTGCTDEGRAVLHELANRRVEPGSLADPRIRICHAGLRMAVVPILVSGQLCGAILAGGYRLRDDHGSRGLASDPPDSDLSATLEPADRIPRLGPTDEQHLCDLVEVLAREAAEFHLQQDPRPAEPKSRRSTRYAYNEIIGNSQPMLDLCLMLDKVIDSDATVLVQGENGTGKELIARAIHFNSRRKARRFVVQNCSALNDNLLDSELFGHRKGAFTGAISDKQGLFEVADGSTFFLDEVGDMSPSLQVKLLRVLQEGTFIPVGDTRTRTVDVRIIAATNRNLHQLVESGQFREDLFYRINVINIRVPPLRERKDDIPLLVEHFLASRSRGEARRRRRLGRSCLERLLAYDWPGNIRELENEIERLLVLAGDEPVIGPDLLSPRILNLCTPSTDQAARSVFGLPEAIIDLERAMIQEVLERNHWNKTRAAEELHISRRNLIRKVSRYALGPRRPR